ncbi:DUF2147 domain-containing protein [Pinibacter soli]|uniref:DUF2147 domain-containing protein n=1 Tax=Pinibacter soli TaxID=3044211 RepID=A0ABT6REH3_9BACT|nr:DUF2147 domain-containing protein [Pinibacter soli]MDI3320811.1 DUF2147 domain-containing protein [Pinibacter soli]
MQKTFSLFLFISICLFAKAQKEPVERVWYNQEKTSKIQVYKGTDGLFYGKLVWLAEPKDASGIPKTDVKNPEENKRNTPLQNLLILKSFKKSTGNANQFEGGTVYDPVSGKTYCGKINVSGKELKLKGYICSFSMLGRTSTWTLAE